MRPPPFCNLARRAIGARFGTPSAPFKLTWAVTWRCNSRCASCRIWKRPAGVELPPADFEEFFRKNPSLAWLDLTGGEPTLREDLAEIGRAAVALLPGLDLLHFPSNGLLPEKLETAVRGILRARPRRLVVTVSLDGPEAVHDRLRGGEGFFARSLESLRRLRKLESRHFRVFPGMTLSAENFRLVGETARMLEKELKGFDPADLHVNIGEVSEHFYGNAGFDLSFRPAALEEVRRHAALGGFARRLSPAGLLERAYLRLAEKYLASGKTPIPCRSGSVSCFIDPAGEIYPCAVDPERLGNIREYGYDLREAWKSEKFAATRARISRGGCPQCWTPCEAYQTLLADFPTLLSRGLF